MVKQRIKRFKVKVQKVHRDAKIHNTDSYTLEYHKAPNWRP